MHRNNIALKDICIAAPNMNLMRELQNRLHTDGTHYQILKGASKQGTTDGLSLCTFHSLKGLEFKVIILIGVNERYVPSQVTKLIHLPEWTNYRRRNIYLPNVHCYM